MGHKLKQPRSIGCGNDKTVFFYHTFRNMLIVGLPLLIISALVMSFPIPLARADGRSSDSVTVTIPTSCTIAVDQNHTTDHEATLNSGQYKQDIGNTRMGAYCNDLSGYYIYAIGYSNNIDGNTNLVSSLGSAYDIVTGTALSGDTSNWAMKISTASSGTTLPYVVDGYRNYKAVPSDYDVVAYRESETASSSTSLDVSGSYIDTTYQAYVTSVQPAGTYVGQVKYTLVHPFDATKLVSVDTAFRIAQKDKYILKTDGTWIIETDPSASSIPESSIAGRYYAMQDMSRGVCNLVTMRGEKTQTQLIDIRDGKLYWTARLADNNCWMTQNLDLNLSSSVALTSDDSNISTDTSLYVQSSSTGPYALDSGYAINTVNNRTVVSWTPERSTYTSTSAPGTENWAGNTGDNSTSGYYHPYSWNRVANNNGDPVYPDGTVTEAAAGNHAQSGNYYNWSAAVASNDSLKASGSQKNSICPKGWRLPVNGEYGTLYNAYKTASHNSNAFGLMASPLWFVRSGFVNGSGGLVNSGSYGYYWSSTVYNTTYSYILYFYGTNVSPANDSYFYDGRFYGFSVRCMSSV